MNIRENKNFFDQNNLNKGYSKSLINKKSYFSSNENYKHILPNADIMSQYEEIYPGTLKRLLELAQKEQEYRHKIELLMLKENKKLAKWGKFFSFLVIGIISVTSICLVILGAYIPFFIFSFLGFGTINLCAYLSNYKLSGYKKNRPPIATKKFGYKIKKRN